MYCSHCGRKNVDGALFCEGCGTRMTAPVGVSRAAAGSAAGAPYAASGAPYATTAAPMSGYHVPKGCVGQAWSDITSSPHWVRRVLTLMVMNCVPVLNFFSSGYGLQWGAQAARNESKPLAAGAFTSKTFVFGLIVALLSLLLTLGTSVFGLISLIPIIGVVVAIAVDLLASAFYFLAALRSGITGKLRSAFDLSELFRAYRKNLGGLFVAAVVPRVLAGIIVAVVAIIALFFVAASDYGYAFYYLDNLGYAMPYYGYSNADVILQALSTLILLVAFLVVVYQFLDGFASLWSMRAVGYWVARNEPQWAKEGQEAKPAQELSSASAAPTAPEAAAAVPVMPEAAAAVPAAPAMPETVAKPAPPAPAASESLSADSVQPVSEDAID